MPKALQSRILWILILAALVVIESRSNTLMLLDNKPEDYEKATWIYFITGILIALIPLFRLRKRAYDLPYSKYLSYLVPVFCSIFFVYMAHKLFTLGGDIIANNPMDYKKADMMPIMQVVAQRFLAGEKIYQVIPEIWNNEVIYFPAMWAPFIPFEMVGVDIRWGTILGIVLGIACVLWVVIYKKNSFSLLILAVFPPVFYLVGGIVTEQTYLIRFTEEGVVIFYYLLLGLSLTTKNPYFQGIAIGLCLLSRYALLFWVPAYLLFVYLYHSKRNALITGGIAAGMVLFLFLIPYGFERLGFFLSIPGEYPDYARRVWTRDPNFFIKALGFAKFFSIETVGLQHKLHMFSVILSPFLLLGAYRFWPKKDQWEPAFFGICALKLCLVFFYNLIIVPVFYLFWVPSFLSCLLLAFYVQRWSLEKGERF